MINEINAEQAELDENIMMMIEEFNEMQERKRLIQER